MIYIIHTLIAVAVVFVVSLLATKLMKDSVKLSAVLPASVIIGAISYFVFMNLVANQGSDALVPIVVVSVIAAVVVGVLRTAFGVKSADG